MIYLASMRDYNTGLYVHQGLAARFSAEVACEALADCHQECFRELISLGAKRLNGTTERVHAIHRHRDGRFPANVERT